MNRNVIITCALTGAGDTAGRSEHVPVTPEEIAESGIAAARAGATVVHIHVRDPQTRQGSRDVALYREVVERIRASDVDVIVNTTAGMGGDLVLDPHDPTTFVEGTDLVSGVERLAHVEQLLPDICTLDCGSLNFGEGSLVYVSTPDMLREGAKRIQDLGVRVEMEIFDTGHLWFARQLVDEGLIDAPPLFQLCMDIPYGAPADPALLAAMVNQLPEGAVWASFALGRMQMPWVAQSVLLGGHVRVGLEDNLYLSRGVKATNAQLVEKARTIVEAMGASVATPDDARELLDLKPRGRHDRHARRPCGARPASARVPASVPAVIGGGWVAYFLARGYDVRAWDPAPDAESRLRHLVDAAWPALTELGLAPGATRTGSGVATTLAEAVSAADFVQESAPEDLDLKIRLLADIDAATPPHVVVSSSTSGYGMSEMQGGCEHPEPHRRGAPVQPAVPHPARGGRRRRPPPTPRWSPGPRSSSGWRASRSSPWSARCPASSPTGSRRRCGGRPCTWWPRARPPWSRSTCPSPTARACAGRCRGR